MDINNCSNTSNISQSVEDYLRHLQDTSNITMIPAVVMMVLFAVTGLVGNILVLVVYSQKMKLTPTKVLIMTIATFDLVANVGAIPSEMNIMFDSWNFSQPGVCKSKVFLGSFTTVGGAISLCVVAVIRFRKVCRPYGWQVSIKQAIISSAVTAFISLLFAIPYIIIYGIKTRQTPCSKIQGYECFADDKYFYTVWPLMNNILFVLLYLSLSVSMVVMYIFIGVTAWRHSQMHGLAAGAVQPKSNSNSTTGLSSTDDQPIDIPTQTHNSSTSNKANRSEHGVFQVILCCRESQRCEKTDDSPLPIVLQNCTATNSTDTETGEQTSESINAEMSFSSADRLQDYVDPLTTISTSERGTRFQNTERDTSLEGKSNSPCCTTIAETYKTNICAQEKETSNRYLKQEKKYLPKQKTAKQTIAGRMETRRRPLGRMTAMLIIISAIFVLGYLPFLTLTVYKNRLPDKYASLNMVELSFYNLFYRLYFLNSAANPIIYSLCDLNFRQQCVRLLTCKSTKFM